MEIWTDGSAQDQSAGYGLYAEAEDARLFVAARSPGVQTAQFAELFAIYHALCIAPPTEVTIYTDNQAARLMITGTSRNHWKRPELVTLILRMIAQRAQQGHNTRIQPVHLHVLEDHSHKKDRHRERMQQLYREDWRRVALGNAQADKLAARGARLPLTPALQLFMSADFAAITPRGEPVEPRNLFRHLEAAYTAARLAQYQRKADPVLPWDYIHTATITQANALLMNSRSGRGKQAAAWIAKVVTGKLPTRARMYIEARQQQIARAQGKAHSEKLAQQANSIYATSQCPFGCPDQETLHHFVTCQRQRAYLWTKLYEAIQDSLSTQGL